MAHPIPMAAYVVVVATWTLQVSRAQFRKLLQFFSISNWILIYYPLMCFQCPKWFSIWLLNGFVSGVDQNFPIEMAKQMAMTGGFSPRNGPLTIKTTPCPADRGTHFIGLKDFHGGRLTSAGQRPGRHFNNGGLGGLPGPVGSHTEVTHEASWPTKTKCAPTCHHYKIQKEPPFISNPLTPNSVLDKFDQTVLLQKAIKSIYSMETAKLNRELKKCTFTTIFLCTRHNSLSTLVEDVFSADLKASLFRNFRIGKHNLYSFAPL